MIIIGDGIVVGNGGGERASIFVTGLSETDTVTATKDGKTIIGKWANVLNPSYYALPDGYTQLEYIASSGTQYINTGVLASDIKDSFIDFQFVSVGDTELEVMAMYLNSSNILQCGWNGTSFITGNGATYSQTSSPNARTTAKVVPVGSPTYNVYLFAQNEKGTSVTRHCNAKIYSCSISTSNGLVRDFIPAKRNSDGVLGLYDLVNGVFYTNSGTGTFKAGAEITQYIDCFNISPIKSYGTWAVTATDGLGTHTQDVLVDAAEAFVVEVTL